MPDFTLSKEQEQWGVAEWAIHAAGLEVRLESQYELGWSDAIVAAVKVGNKVIRTDQNSRHLVLARATISAIKKLKRGYRQ